MRQTIKLSTIPVSIENISVGKESLNVYNQSQIEIIELDKSKYY